MRTTTTRRYSTITSWGARTSHPTKQLRQELSDATLRVAVGTSSMGGHRHDRSSFLLQGTYCTRPRAQAHAQVTAWAAWLVVVFFFELEQSATSSPKFNTLQIMQLWHMHCVCGKKTYYIEFPSLFNESNCLPRRTRGKQNPAHYQQARFIIALERPPAPAQPNARPPIMHS